MNPPSRRQVDWQDQTAAVLRKRLSESGIQLSARNPTLKVLLVDRVLRVEYQEREASKEPLDNANDPTTNKRRLRAEADEKYVLKHLEIDGKARRDHYERQTKASTAHTSNQKHDIQRLFTKYRHSLEQHRKLPGTFPMPSPPDASSFYHFKKVDSLASNVKDTSSKILQTFAADAESQANYMINHAPVDNPTSDMVFDPNSEVPSGATSVSAAQENVEYGDNVECSAMFVDLEHGIDDINSEQGIYSAHEFDHDFDSEQGNYAEHAVELNGGTDAEDGNYAGIFVEEGADAKHAIVVYDSDDSDSSDEKFEPPTKKRKLPPMGKNKRYIKNEGSS